MQILYDNLNISFTIDHTAFSILNIALERLTRPIPAHSHGENCYEVHYISQGFGLLKNDTCVYDIGPDTLYLTGPNIIHEQTSIPSDPMIEYSVYFHMTCPSEKPVFFTPLKNIPFWICQGNKDMHPIFKKLFEELQTQNEGYLLLAASLLQLCICMLVRKCAHTVTPPQKNLISDTLQSIYPTKETLLQKKLFFLNIKPLP